MIPPVWAVMAGEAGAGLKRTELVYSGLCHAGPRSASKAWLGSARGGRVPDHSYRPRLA